MFNGAGVPMATDRWHQVHYPFGGYGQAPKEELGPFFLKIALAFAAGWIAHDYYERTQGRRGP
jgi:hypothetical protein